MRPDGVWKPLSDVPRYSVSSDGRVFDEERQLLVPQVSNKGYSQVTLRFGVNNRKTIKVHRLVAELFLDPSSGRSQVNHKSGVKSDNRVENLEWCTHAENVKHAYDNGLMRFDADRLARMSRSRMGKCVGADNTKAKRVLCVTTGEVFGSVGDASRKYGIYRSGIARACLPPSPGNHKRNYAGKHPETGEKMVWKYCD